MYKFLDKKRKLDDSDKKYNEKQLKKKVTEPIKLGPPSSGSSNKYQDNYLNFGFTHCGTETYLIPQCLICGEKLSNVCVVPNKVKRHLASKHGHLLNKDKTFLVVNFYYQI